MAADKDEQFAIVARAFFLASAVTLSLSAKWTFAALRLYADKQGNCWPSYTELQRLTGLSPQGVTNAIAELEKHEYLSRQRVAGKPTIYTLATQDVGVVTTQTSGVVSQVTTQNSRVPLLKVFGVTTQNNTGAYKEEQTMNRPIEQTKDMSNIRSTAGSVSKSLSPAEEVFQHWKTSLNHLKAKFDSRRKKLIEARLKEDFSVDDLKAAIDGCKHSSFHQGDNDRFRKYDGIKVIFRDAEQVEHFIEMCPGAVTSRNGNGAAPKKEYCGNCYGGWLPSDPSKGETCAKQCSCVTGGDESANPKLAVTVEDLPPEYRRITEDATDQQIANVIANYNRRVREEADRGGSPPIVSAPAGYRQKAGVKPVQEYGIRACPEIGVTYCGQCHNGWVYPQDGGVAKMCGCEQARRTGKDNYTHYSDGRAKPAHIVGMVV